MKITILMYHFLAVFSRATSFEHATRLQKKLFQSYNKWLRPTSHYDDIIFVGIRMEMKQIIDVNERNMLMTSNILLHQQWFDVNMKWKPEDYGNVSSIMVPANEIWSPEIALFENAGNDFNYTHGTIARIRYDGLVSWSSPAFCTTVCKIDITYFPFDSQNCTIKFASWSYHAAEVQLYFDGDEVTFKHFIPNSEWELLDIRLTKHHEGTSNGYGGGSYVNYLHPDVVFHPTLVYVVELYRMPLFFCFFIILPCMGIFFFTAFVFLVPATSDSKITLSMSVLLAHTLYILVLLESMPKYTSGIPIITEYLLFNMIFISLSIVMSTMVLNVHHRYDDPAVYSSSATLPPQLYKEIEYIATCTQYIKHNLKKKMSREQVKEEWKFIASLLDRAFLVFYLSVAIFGSVVLIASAWIEQSYGHMMHSEENELLRDNMNS